MKTLLVITWSASLMALVAEIKGGDKDDDSQWSGNLRVPFRTTTAPRPLAPYGPHSACRMILGTRKCFCLSGYVGTPPNCKPECDSSLQCPYNSVCSNEKCVPICHGACGVRAECQVIDHKPSCSCPPGYTGDPKAACELYLDKKDSPKSEASKLQCTPNHQCPDNETCISGRCTDICPLNCGLGAKCEIVNHIANCTCPPGEEGDPYSKCSPIQRCTSPSCGQSALELPDNKPECTINNDCSAKEVCLNRKCVNSCSGTCGVGAECHITNHVPFCSCPPGLTGDPYNMCV